MWTFPFSPYRSRFVAVTSGRRSTFSGLGRRGRGSKVICASSWASCRAARVPSRRSTAMTSSTRLRRSPLLPTAPVSRRSLPPTILKRWWLWLSFYFPYLYFFFIRSFFLSFMFFISLPLLLFLFFFFFLFLFFSASSSSCLCFLPFPYDWPG